jgi:hypothetical protein
MAAQKFFTIRGNTVRLLHSRESNVEFVPHVI